MEELADIAINLVSDAISFVLGSLLGYALLKKDSGVNIDICKYPCLFLKNTALG
tara:strand:- start:5825 stop:5986 length:162 start_codon:yes stop_codon:yes gene_type:complete